jgi:hypothetical protein
VERALDLIGDTLNSLDIMAKAAAPDAASASKLAVVLRGLGTYVAGHAELIIDYAVARRRAEPISTATTESTVHWLLHRRMNASQQMRWSPCGAHLTLKVQTSVVNGTLDRDHAFCRMAGQASVSSGRLITPRISTVSWYISW